MKNNLGKISGIVTAETVETCTADSTISECLHIFKQSLIGCLVVTEPNGKKPVGVFTERDYITKIAGKNIDIKTKTIKEYMTPNPVSLKESDDAILALIKMRMGKFRHIVIIDDSGDLKSIVSIRDVSEHIVDNYR